MTAHSAQTKNHKIHDSDLIYATEALLLAATGFTSDQVGMVGFATAEQSFWILVDDSPLTWGKIILDGGTSSVILQQYGVVVNDLGNITGSTDIDLDDGNAIEAVQTGDATFTFSNPQVAGIKSSFTLVITNDASSPWTRTWPGGVVWPGGVEPTLTGTALATDIYTFFTIDGGTVWYGFLPGADMS